MSEHLNKDKLASLSYLSKVQSPIIMLIKALETKILHIVSVPSGGSAGQILVKNTEIDGDVSWADVAVDTEQVEDNLKAYIDEQIKLVEPDNIDDGEI